MQVGIIHKVLWSVRKLGRDQWRGAGDMEGS
jgi:hypothetical protein